uniref:CYTH domain-containing protein n=1 Tax=Micrococcus phage Kurnik TaxID=3092208 RepID=A0AAU6R6Z3_9CAUD
MATTAYPNETNPLVDGAAYHANTKLEVSLKELEERGGKITRVRVFRERTFYEISYIHGEIDGVQVRVTGMEVGPTRFIKRELVERAQEQGVFAKGLGLLDEANWSILS